MDMFDLRKKYFEIEEKLSGLCFEDFWPGFQKYEFALYNEEIVVLNGEMIAKTDIFLANTAILYEERYIAIWNLEEDWDTEYNDYILAVKTVASTEEAVEHIRRYTTGHSEAIITENRTEARYFVSHIDAAAVYVNASTRFTDGGEFGFGAEIGISTQKLHARGPMGLDQFTTVKYIVEGDGNVR